MINCFTFLDSAVHTLLSIEEKFVRNVYIDEKSRKTFFNYVKTRCADVTVTVVNLLVTLFYDCTRFGGTYTKIGTIQRRLAWIYLRFAPFKDKDDCEAPST